MKLAPRFTSRQNRRQFPGRTLTFETLQCRDMLAADGFIGPRPPRPDHQGPVVEFNLGDTALVDDIDLAFSGMFKTSRDLVGNAAGNAPTEVVNGGQAAHLAGGATEVVNGGQEALRAAAGEWDHLPKFIQTAEYAATHSAHLRALSAGDMAEAIRTSNEMRALQVLEYPDGSRVHALSGKPYVPASQVDDVVETAAESCTAGSRVAGKVFGAACTVADFVVDPVLGTVFYDDNLATGESVFGEDSYCSEAYANLQCVPALGGPLADVAACAYTVWTTDWGTYFFGADDVPSPEEAREAIERYRDLEDRKDYDANHGNLYQEYLWEKVQSAKAELEAMGINPAAVR